DGGLHEAERGEERLPTASRHDGERGAVALEDLGADQRAPPDLMGTKDVGALLFHCARLLKWCGVRLFTRPLLSLYRPRATGPHRSNSCAASCGSPARHPPTPRLSTHPQWSGRVSAGLAWWCAPVGG